MKIGKMGLWLVGIGVFALALVSLGTVRSQQGTESARLKTQLQTTQAKIMAVQTEPLAAQQATLQQQLDQALQDMAQAKGQFSKSSDSVATTAIIFRVAQAQGVSIDNIMSSGATNQTLEGVTYTVLPVGVKVTGSVNSLISFISSLNQELGTGVMQTATINVPTGTTIPATGQAQQSTVDIQLSIYTYRGN